MNFRQLKLVCSIASLSAAIFAANGMKAQAEIKNTQTEIQESNKVAQFSPGRSTRSGSSYIGAGGFIGFDDDSSFGDGGIAVTSKIGFSRNFSVRPSVFFDDEPVFLIPVTVDFPVNNVADTGFQRLSVAPYLGAGISINADNDNDGGIGFLVSGGVDVPISRKLTATGGLHIDFSDDADVGLLLGVGYNF